MSELVHGGGRMIPADVPPTEIEQAAFDFEQVVQKLGGLRAALLGASAQAIETEVMGLECILEQLNARDQTVSRPALDAAREFNGQAAAPIVATLKLVRAKVAAIRRIRSRGERLLQGAAAILAWGFYGAQNGSQYTAQGSPARSARPSFQIEA
jgi:hypothetical protein